MSAPDTCVAVGSKSRQYVGGPYIEFVTVQVPAAVGQAAADVFVKFANPHRMIFIASITDSVQTASVFFHLNPLSLSGKYQASATITPTGQEPYITMWKTNAISGGLQSRYIKFKVPIQQFYVDADHSAANPAGGFYNITFGGTDDIELMNVMQGGN